MVTVTFATSGHSLAISTSIVYGTGFSTERKGQVLYLTGANSYLSYDISGANIVTGTIKMKNVSRADGYLLETFIHQRMLFKHVPFSITCNPGTLINLGLGDNTAITNARYNSFDTDIFEQVPPGLFNIEFPYTFIR